MLVLTRKAQEQIHIGHHIKLTIVQVKGRSVRIGIDAPPEVRIERGELAAAMAEFRDDPAASDEEAESEEIDEPVAAGSPDMLGLAVSAKIDVAGAAMTTASREGELPLAGMREATPPASAPVARRNPFDGTGEHRTSEHSTRDQGTPEHCAMDCHPGGLRRPARLGPPALRHLVCR